jgi:hypothetical protein
MEYALHAPQVAQRAVVVPLVAFLIGGGAAVGVVALSGGLESSSASNAPTLITVPSQGSNPAPADQTSGARP